MAEETKKEKDKRKADALAKSKDSTANLLMSNRKKKKERLDAIMKTMK